MTEPIIAVIDSDPNFLTTINETLAQSGYIAILSQGDPRTQHLIQRENPALIIIDGTMCHTEDPHGLLESVIADATVKHIPLLMTVSSQHEPPFGPGQPADRCIPLSKPIDPNELESKLRHALGPLAVTQTS